MTEHATSPDHRTRVAAERRERMRRRLIESAMIVFAERGVGASVIPEVVAAAEVSQGSFYNYFRTNEDLLAAVSNELNGEVIQLIEPVVGAIADPALRVATGMRHYLHLARSHRLLARFLAAAGLRLLDKQGAAHRYLPADLEEGQRSGCFAAGALDVLMEVMAGSSLVAIDRMARTRTPKDYPERTVEVMLRALGLSPSDTARVLGPALPKLHIPPDSLLARAQARADAKADANTTG